MTAAELIAELQKMPQDTEVRVAHERFTEWPTDNHEVHKVYLHPGRSFEGAYVCLSFVEGRSIDARIADWCVTHDSGMSSLAILTAYRTGMAPHRSEQHYPADTGDLGRCLRLLKFVPEAIDGVAVLASQPGGHIWRELYAIWHDLTGQAQKEGVLSHKSTFGYGAPQTYALLRATIDRGREAEKSARV